LNEKKPRISGKINIHVINVGECGKCNISLNSFFLRMADKGYKNVSITNDPRECNCLIMLGSLLKIQKNNLVDTWQKIRKPHVIISFGACGTDQQKLFKAEQKEIQNLAFETDDIAEVVPVDYVFPGCPPDEKFIDSAFREIIKLNF
jgi:formate hydrogenlyase subunit 7